MPAAVDGQFPDPAVPMLAHELAGVSDPLTYLDAMLELLEQLFPRDAIGWNALDTSTGAVRLRGKPAEVYNGPVPASTLAEVATTTRW
jgi:hypothetical protein